MCCFDALRRLFQDPRSLTSAHQGARGRQGGDLSAAVQIQLSGHLERRLEHTLFSNS